MSDECQLPAVNIPRPPPTPSSMDGPAFAAAKANASSPFRSGKRRINEREVAYAASLELPLASGKRTFGGPRTLAAGTLGGIPNQPERSASQCSNNNGGGGSGRGAAGVSSYGASGGVVAVVFGGAAGERGLDGDSSPALAKRYNEALYADMKLRNVQARVEAAAALRKSGKAGGDEEELDDEGNPKPKKKRGGGTMIGDYSPRKRIEDYLFLKQGKQWCPPTSHNGGIPQYESPRRKGKKSGGEDGDGGDSPRLTAQRQEALGERMMKPLRRDNPKKNKPPPPKPRKHADGTEMTKEEQEKYEKTLVKNLQKRLEGYEETQKKTRQLALDRAAKEDAKLQKPVKKLDTEEALQRNIMSLYTEPINKKQSEAAARLRKEAAAKEKLKHMTKREQSASGRRMHEEGIEKQRAAVAKAAERYLLRPATASPTASYNASRPDIESRYCPGLSFDHRAASASPRDRPATAAVSHVPKPPANPRAAH